MLVPLIGTYLTAYLAGLLVSGAVFASAVDLLAHYAPALQPRPTLVGIAAVLWPLTWLGILALGAVALLVLGVGL